MTTIPEDVAALIRQAARAEPAGIVGEASRLCQKYGINTEPETLAERDGTVAYSRVYIYPTGGGYISEYGRPEGVHVDPDSGLVRWPDDGGICQLLNDGWRLIPSDELEMGVHEVYNPRCDDETWDGAGVASIRGATYRHYALAREVAR